MLRVLPRGGAELMRYLLVIARHILRGILRRHRFAVARWQLNRRLRRHR